MNFSGTRYTKQALADTLSNSDLECYLIDAEDKFGKYGYIGFAVLRRGVAPQVIDLAFSCRVQSKRVEHAVLISLMMKHSALGARSFEVLYRPTEKNAQVAQVFDDLKFSNISRGEAGLVYRLDISSEIPRNEFVKVEFKELGALAVRDAVA
jgi:predicted enzyme involved in methoxymalonyl-ACP biosynthesis